MKCITFKHEYQMKAFSLQKSVGSKLYEPTCPSGNYDRKTNENEIFLVACVSGCKFCSYFF